MKIDTGRRRLMAGAAGLASATFGARAWAVDAPGWPAEKFSKTIQSAALESVTKVDPQVSPQVLVLGPHIVEDGAVVPITVQTQLADVKRISLFVPHNPLPLAAIFHIPPGTEPYISARLKMAATSDVIAVVETAHGVYKNSKSVKVTRGGCGG